MCCGACVCPPPPVVAMAARWRPCGSTESVRECIWAAARQIPDDIVELHATAAGLKGLCTFLAADGIEDLRKVWPRRAAACAAHTSFRVSQACGGHGYMKVSGVASLAADYVWQTTAEGDYIVMLLQLARFLVKAAEDVRAHFGARGDAVPHGGAC